VSPTVGPTPGKRSRSAQAVNVASCYDHVHEPPVTLTKRDFEALAAFRFAIRFYLRFSEDTVRAHGVSLQQYQIMLALAGFPGREWATVKELAERLQLKHHSVCELVNRAQHQDLVARAADPDDARVVRVVLTTAGVRALGLLAALHRDELHHTRSALTPPPWQGEGQQLMSEAESDRSLSRRSAGGEEGGDSVCWLERVCDDCGALVDGPPEPVCARCGSPQL
jgi:DNA-binding MarR family transcriptional regulator